VWTPRGSRIVGGEGKEEEREEIISLPFDTMSGSEHISVVDQRAAAVELIEI